MAAYIRAYRATPKKAKPIVPDGFKRCPRCNTIYPASVDYFYPRKKGLTCWCRTCTIQSVRARYIANPKVKPIAPDGYKFCTKCGEIKPVSVEYFHRNKMTTDGFRPHCKVCVAEYARVYRKVNARKRIEYGRQWYAANKAHTVRRNHAHYKANRELYRAAYQRRRARKLAAEGSHTAADIQAQYKRQNGKCYWCGKKVHETYHVDHIIPLSRGGSDNADNLVISCPYCNLSRGSRLPSEWIEGGRLL
jgi:5-methylcytosine-specific restriction endonuclease McrA